MWCPQSPVHWRYLQCSHRRPSRSHLSFHQRQQGLNGQILDPEWQALWRKLSIIQGPPLPKNTQPPLNPESQLHGRKAKYPDNRNLWFKSMGLQAGNGPMRLISGCNMLQSPWGPACSPRAEGCLFSIQYQSKSSAPLVCDCHHHIPPHTIDGASIYITTEKWRRGHRDSSRTIQKIHKVTHIPGTPPSANLQGNTRFISGVCRNCTYQGQYLVSWSIFLRELEGEIFWTYSTDACISFHKHTENHHVAILAWRQSHKS